MTPGTDVAKKLSLFSADTVPVGEDGLRWVPVRRELDVSAFGVNLWRSTGAGAQVIEEHVESPGQEELYVVIAGSARFVVDGEEFELEAGDALFVPDPEARRSGTALSDDAAVLAVGGWSGEAYRTLPWEPIYLAQAAAAEEDWASAADVLDNGSGRSREFAYVRYHLARAFAKLGDDEKALEELRLALADSDELVARAAEDEAFAELRRRDDWPA